MAENILKEVRTELIKRLTERVISGLLDDLQEKEVIGDEETEDIKQKMKTRADQARDLIDGVKRKGDKASEVMLTCLKTRDKSLYDNLNIDRLLAVPETAATSSHPPETTGSATGVCEEQSFSVENNLLWNGRSQGMLMVLHGTINADNYKPNTMTEYKMDSNPRGLCLIINNENFGNPKMKRNGSQKDVGSLKILFESLGFVVEIKKDQTVSNMKMIMKQYSEDGRHGDCFVCCVMSHGDETGVVGCDHQICPMDDITSPFDGVNCPSLAGKPKVFFIQACRGHGIQRKVLVSDGSGPSDMDKSGRVSYSIPKDSDFLIAKSTVDGYVSVRDECSGSWFIQSLCKHLEEGSKRGHDILRILTNVNNDVSHKEGRIKSNNDEVDVKMTPQPIFTLRKLLIFRPLKKSWWFS